MCTIGLNNALLHRALTVNQLHNETKHAQEFNPVFLRRNSNSDDGEQHLSGNVTNDDTVVAHETDGDRHSEDDETEVVSVEKVQGDSVHEGDGLAPLHPADLARSKRLSYILNTVKHFPHHVTTLIIGDSNLHGVNGKEVDSEGSSVNVRSVGGLCVFSAVAALRAHTHCYRRIKQVAWSLGTNDALHHSQHCEEDKQRYLELLYTESKRMFPAATIKFILPFPGMEKVPTSYIKELTKDVKSMCPNMKCYRPPSMRQKLCRDGVHLNRKGKDEIIKFLQKQFLPRGIQIAPRGGPTVDHNRVPQQVSHQNARSYASVTRENVPAQAPRVRYVSEPLDAAHERGAQHVYQQTFPAQEVHSNYTAVHDIADALAYVMRLRRQEPHQSNFYQGHSG